MIKLVITDVDGTLLKESTMNLNPEYYDVIRALVKKGIKVVFASGRQYKSICDLVEPVKDLVWFVSDGGASIKMDGELQAVKEIPKEWVKKAYRDISNIPEMDCQLCTPQKVYMPFSGTELYNRSVNDYGYNAEVLGGWDKLPEEPICKISLYRSKHIDTYSDKYFIPKWEDKLHMSIAGEWWLDCMMHGVNKGTALQKIMDICGIHAEEVLATGDNPNDYEMIKLAGRGLAVATAHPMIKEAADGIIPSYTEDGVLQEWKKLL